MYFSATVAVTVLMALGASSAAVEDPACLPQPGEKHVHAGECCKVHYSVPETMMGSIKLCMKTQPLPSPHKHMDISLPALRAKFSCMGECVFQNLSLLTEDTHLDKEAVKKYFSGQSAEAVVDKCLDMYEEDIDTSQECKSGAEEFHRCLNRQAFLSCPEDKYSDTEECQAYKAKVVKCPMMPVHMGPPPPHHHEKS